MLFIVFHLYFWAWIRAFFFPRSSHRGCLCIPVFSRRDSRTFPQPIKDRIIGPDWVKQICNQAKTLQLKLQWNNNTVSWAASHSLTHTVNTHAFVKTPHCLQDDCIAVHRSAAFLFCYSSWIRICCCSLIIVTLLLLFDACCFFRTNKVISPTLEMHDWINLVM